MEFRELGRSGLQVSPLCFGGNVFGWTADEPTSFALLDAWLDAGFNFIDTADVYSIWAPGHIDLYQAHDDDADTPMAETLGAFADLIKAGKVRAIGASNFTAPRLAEALRVSAALGLPRYESLQPLFNAMDRAVFEDDLQPLCVAQGVGVINFYGLAAGFLTGKYRRPEDASKSTRGKTVVARYLNERGLRVLAALDTVAARHGAQPGQVALAWQMLQPAITAPIASATSLPQLAELVAAAHLKLGDEDLTLIAAATATDAASA